MPNFKLEKDHHLQIYPRNQVEFVRGEGAYLFDAQGKSYLDFLSGIAVNALGHSHPKVVQAIQEQVSKYIHLSNLAQMPTQSQLAKLLTEATGFDRVFFCNSGTEANEAVIKFIRKYWILEGQSDRLEIITMNNSFHGRTYGALALTGQPKLQENFGPLVPGIQSIELNQIEELKATVSDQTAAVMLEPILAEGGILTPSPQYIQALHELRDQYGFLIVADEIQTGAGRLGTFLGSEAVGLKPDMVSMAKPIGGGLPLGAVLLKDKQAQAIVPGDHGTTFGGNPVSCAAGIALVQEVSQPAILDNVAKMSQLIQKGLADLSHKYDVYQGIRGTGLLLGLETTLDTAAVIAKCQENGLIIARAGANVLRFLPPLNICEEDVKLFLTKLELSTQELI